MRNGEQRNWLCWERRSFQWLPVVTVRRLLHSVALYHKARMTTVSITAAVEQKLIERQIVPTGFKRF